MELCSDRLVATLDMSQNKSKDEEPFNSDGDYESLPPHVSVTTHMTAGAVAGILEHTVMYPVDSVKVTHREAQVHTCFAATDHSPTSSRAALTVPTVYHSSLTSASYKISGLPILG